MRNKEKFVFYLETFLLTVSFVLVIVTLSSFLIASERKALYAKDLTNVVCLSENVAETTKSADSIEDLLELLNENGNAAQIAERITVTYDEELRPDKDGKYKLIVTYTENDGMVEATIDAYAKEEKIYTLDLGQYKGGTQ